MILKSIAREFFYRKISVIFHTLLSALDGNDPSSVRDICIKECMPNSILLALKIMSCNHPHEKLNQSKLCNSRI